MNILIISDYYPPYIGGVEIVMKNIAEQLADRGHNVNVLTTKIPGSAANERKNGVEIFRVRTPTTADRAFFSLSATLKATRLAKRADVIHTTTWFAPFPSALAKLFTNTPVIMTFHESLSRAYARTNSKRSLITISEFLENLISILPVDATTAVSNHTKKEIQNNLTGFEPKVIYNGVDNDLFSSGNVNPYLNKDIQHRFLYFGRPGFSKGVDQLIDAFERFSRSNTGGSSELFLLLSTSPKKERKKVVRRVKKSDCDSITVNDPVEREKLPAYIEHTDYVVVPSLSEGFGFTAAESCSVGTPVITTTAGSLPEVVSGKHITVPPNDVEALASAMERACQDEFRVKQQLEFRWEDAVYEYIQMYKQVINKHENRD